MGDKECSQYYSDLFDVELVNDFSMSLQTKQIIREYCHSISLSYENQLVGMYWCDVSFLANQHVFRALKECREYQHSLKRHVGSFVITLYNKSGNMRTRITLNEVNFDFDLEFNIDALSYDSNVPLMIHTKLLFTKPTVDFLE